MADTDSNDNSMSDEELHAHWTEERIAAAIPKPPPILELPDNYRAGAHQDEPRFTPPNTSIEDRMDAQAEAAVLTGTPVATPATWPWSTNGKLFFDWKGTAYVGSAHSVYLQTILTAGHNVYDEGEWSTNFYYHPGYPQLPGGKAWGWKRAAIFTAWMNNTDYAHDYAAIYTNTPMTEVGSSNVVFGVSPTGRTWTEVGYPSKAPYPDPGNVMYQSTGQYLSGFGTNILAMSYDNMTQGSSGGAWLTDVNGFLYPNGVKSRVNFEAAISTSPAILQADYDKLISCVLGSCT